MSKAIECPECHNNSLIKRRDDLYQCLKCNFKKDFSQTEVSPLLLFAMIVAIVFITFNSFKQTSSSYSNSSDCQSGTGEESIQIDANCQ